MDRGIILGFRWTSGTWLVFYNSDSTIKAKTHRFPLVLSIGEDPSCPSWERLLLFWDSRLGKALILWRFLFCELCFIVPGNILSKDIVSWDHTRQYTYFRSRILKSYSCTRQYTYFGSRILKLYQAIYLLQIDDSETIPGNIPSQGWGSRNSTRRYTVLWQRFMTLIYVKLC